MGQLSFGKIGYPSLPVRHYTDNFIQGSNGKNVVLVD